MTVKMFERFLSPQDRAKAVAELSDQGDAAIPLLDSLFNGEARNEFGLSYRDIGAYPVGLECASRLGPKAKPLETYLRTGVLDGWPRAATSLGKLQDVEQASVDALASLVDSGGVDAQAEAALALIKQGFSDHPSLLGLENRSASWRHWLASWRKQYSSE